MTNDAKTDSDTDSAWAFDRETEIQPTGPGRWSTTVHRHWNINENPNGGYAVASLLRAMKAQLGGHPDPASITTHFLRPALADRPAELVIDVVREGRRTATVKGTSIQDGKPRLEVIATFADLATVEDPFALHIEPADIPGPDDCVDRVEAAQGVDLPLLSRVEVRVDRDYIERAGKGEPTVAGWIRFQDRRPPDTAALTLFADCFPPSVFGAVDRAGWVPTIELTVQVRRRPTPGWIMARFTTTELAGQFMIEDGVLWDETGLVVAQARQLALVTM